MSTASERRALLQELAAQGFRLTAQRRALVEIIQTANAHLDADSLLELGRQRQPKLNLVTVYRTIKLLKRLNLIDELDFMHVDGEKHYYEATTGRDHGHLACFRCGRIEEYSSPIFDRLQRAISKQTGFTIRVARLEIGGTCQACTKEEIRATN
jgi:Fur family ferric uptake transcriptional regulator